MITSGIIQSGLSAGNGSFSNASSNAPAIEPSQRSH
ncbi:hypothetical protein ABIF90_007259 [Bradyrhizobium japonicum]